MLGMGGSLTFILSTVVFIFLIIFIDLMFKDLRSLPEYGDPFVPVMVSWMIYMAIFAMTIVGGIILLAGLSVITGVLLHIGRFPYIVLASLIICLTGTFMLFLFTLIPLVLFSHVVFALPVIIMLAGIAFWFYIVYVLARSWDTFNIDPVHARS